jgi:lysophospholipase L1-like esterase
MRSIFLFSLPTLLTIASAYCPPTAFLLAGDSTTASLSANGGGWGDGFNATLVPPGVCENHALNGRSTKTFIENGDWGRLLDSAAAFREKEYRVFVTIQFGHNDQKLVGFEEQFKTSLKAMVGDVRGKGGVPVSSES